MCLDECPPADTPPDYLRVAVARTIHWAERCRESHRRPDQALFGIVQGGMDVDLRASCAEALARFDFPGYALGGFSVGETPDQMAAALRPTAPLVACTQTPLSHGRRSTRRYRRSRLLRHRHVRLRDAHPQRPKCRLLLPTTDRSACAMPAISEIPRRFRPIADVMPVVISAGPICIISFSLRRCSGRRCYRSITSLITCD